MIRWNEIYVHDDFCNASFPFVNYDSNLKSSRIRTKRKKNYTKKHAV